MMLTMVVAAGVVARGRGIGGRSEWRTGKGLEELDGGGILGLVDSGGVGAGV
ncbi:putative formin-like protein 5 [Iris pallida]|uniref:Formin-like protein 5 n=1 Tax=Iris pallida TaxID=29817 RepID=A0AAX6GJ59_IRIPA|nr:putative formin-like protein 5 [Iris pallida]